MIHSWGSYYKFLLKTNIFTENSMNPKCGACSIIIKQTPSELLSRGRNRTPPHSEAFTPPSHYPPSSPKASTMLPPDTTALPELELCLRQATRHGIFLCLASITQHLACEIHPRCRTWHGSFISTAAEYFLVFLYHNLSSFWWILGLFLVSSYYK